jgi:hypothetical protein
VLSVVTAELPGHEEELLDFLLTNDVPNVDLTSCLLFDWTMGDPPPPISPGAYGDVLIKMYDLWLKRGNPAMRIRRFATAHAFMAGRSHGRC